MGTLSSLAIKLEDLLAHLLKRGAGRLGGRYEIEGVPCWDDEEPGTFIVILRDKQDGVGYIPTTEDVLCPIEKVLLGHRNVVVDNNPIGVVHIDDVAVGKPWEKELEYAGWILLSFKATNKVEKETTGGSGQDNVIHVSFGPRG